jgi:iron complex outermembrane receptor protein
MYSKNKTALSVRSALLVGAAAFLSSAAFAQDAISTSKDEETKAQDTKTERIQVTGSRIRTDGLESAVPIEILSADVANAQGLATLSDLLRTSTIASGSNQLTSALTVGYVTAGGAGNESVSMRGLGSNRTLILLNGRRAGPAGTRGQVNAFDLNSLPVSLIERVEILKDGASSLYGSDAVAGVINIITKKGDDSSVNVSLSQPFESGGENKRIDFTVGKTFDKGSFRVMADYKVQTELARGDRDYFSCKERVIFDQTTGERADPIDPRTGSYHCADTQSGIWVYEHNATTHPTGNFLSGMKAQYDYGGVIAGLDPRYARPMPGATGPNGITLPENWYPVSYDRDSDAIANADHAFQDLQSFTPESEVGSLYFQGDYNLTDDIRIFGDVLHSRRTTEINSYRQFWNGDRRILGTALVGENDYNQGWGGASSLQAVAMTDWSGSETDINYTRYVIGADGTIGDWNWEVSYQNSYNKGTYKSKIIYKDSMDLAQSLLPTVANPTAEYCNGQVTPYSGKTCVNLRWLDPEFNNGNLTPAERDFLFGWDRGVTTYRQSTLEAVFSGDLYELPAGQLATAFGVQYQQDELNDVPGEQTLVGNLWGSSSSGVTAGDQSTRAVFSEFQIPLLSDLFLVKQLDVTLSGRWTDVNTYGSDTTYKAGINWDIAAGFRLRASRGSSFRSPALFELYLGNQSGYLAQSTADPCLNWSGKEADGTIDDRILANCKAAGIPASYTSAGSSATSYTSGGAGWLKAETSIAETYGLVWTSEDNEIGASVDYYQYDISGQISSVSGSSITSTCYKSANFASEPLCNQFTRRDGTDGDYGIDEIFGGYLNVASQKMRGIDLSFNYGVDTDLGRFGFDYKHNIQLEQTYQLFADSEPDQYIGDVGSPKHSGVARFSLNRDGWSYIWSTNYTGKADDWKYFSSTTTAYRGERYNFIAHVPSYFTHTASARTQFENGVDLTFGVANVFGKEPPQVSAAGGFYQAGYSALYSQYDSIGRRVFLNMSYNF